MVSTTLSTGKKGEMWSLRNFRKGVTEGSEKRESDTAAVMENSSTVVPTAAMILSVQCVLKLSSS